VQAQLGFFRVEILHDRLDDQIVHRPIALLAQLHETLDDLLVPSLVGNVDLELAGRLFPLLHSLHLGASIPQTHSLQQGREA